MAINFSNLGNQIQGVSNQLNTISRQTTNISREVNALLASTQTNLNIPTRLLQEPLSAVSNDLEVALNENLNTFQQSINNTIAQMDTALSFNLPNITNIGTTVATGINQIASQIDGSVNDFISSLNTFSSQGAPGFSGQLTQLQGVLGNVTQGLTGFTTAIPNFSQQLTNALPNIPAEFGQISANVTNFNNKLTSGITNLQNQVTNAAGSINSLVSNAGQALQETVQNIVGAGLERVLGIVGNISNIGALLAGSLSGARNPISVLSSTAAIAQGVGERFTEAMQSFENRSEFTNSALLGNQTYSSGTDNSNRFGSSRVPNPLRSHNTYNYIVTLGCISSTEYNTGTYKQTGLSQIILRSGGGERSKRVKTVEEDMLGADLEYFIEDLEIDAVIAPNQNTGIALGTTIRFKVIEPYSMSQFLEALATAASRSGYSNYLNATFCLKIDFVGWDEYGKSSKRYVEKPVYVPIRLLKMDFSVTEGGSEYRCEAISYAEIGMDDSINQTMVQIGANGFSVADVLENSNNSVTGVINDHLEQLETNGQVPATDRYLILFPKQLQDIYDIVNNSSDISIPSLTTPAEVAEAIRIGTPNGTATISDSDTATIVEDFTGAPPIYRKLKYYSLFSANMNAIGISALNTDTRDGQDQIPTPAGSMINADGLVYRASPEAEPAQNSRRFNYNENYRITSIIEDIVLSSEYCKDISDKIIAGTAATNGKISWFRITPIVFIESTGRVETQTGNTVNTYVYAVQVYEIDEGKFLGPSKSASGSQALRNSVVKEYNYFYTGQNEDILNFDINFNMAFYNAISADMSNTRSTDASSITGTETPSTTSINQNVNTPNNLNSTPQPGSRFVNSSNRNPSGGRLGRISESRRRQASEFHNRIINSPIDMITAEMEIWGDPYFIPNYQGPGSPEELVRYSINEDGTMSYITDEVMLIVNFRTPLDYQINGFVMNFPELVRPFSGLFNVWAVTNVFSEGKFSQTLKLIRRNGQDSEGTGNSSQYVRGGRGNVVERPGERAAYLNNRNNGG